MAVYRTKQRDPLSERLIDAGIGTVGGVLMFFILAFGVPLLLSALESLGLYV